MIVLDEQLDDPRITKAITQWYKGSVVNVEDLRPRTLVLDDAVPTLLRRVKQPTFVTINYKDFWKVMPASPAYCVVCFRLPGERSLEVPDLLRELLSLPEFSTKRARMGCVVSVAGRRIEVYRAP